MTLDMKGLGQGKKSSILSLDSGKTFAEFCQDSKTAVSLRILSLSTILLEGIFRSDEPFIKLPKQKIFHRKSRKRMRGVVIRR